MPNTDAYEWVKSNMPQDMMKQNPFSNYQYNYINDINSSIYQNSTQSLLQYDLSSLFNSSVFTSTQSHFVVIPIVRCAEAFDAGNAHVDLTDSSYYLTALKNLNTCLVHQVDLLVNGKTIQQLQPFTNIATGIKLLSELSRDDLALYGPTLGILEPDNPDSMTYRNAVTNNYSAPGIANNLVSGTPYPNISSATIAQGSGISNGALQLKTQLNKCSSNSFSNLSAITNNTNMNEEFQPSFQLVSGRAVWTDYVIIFMKDILDAMDKIGLVRRFDGVLRIYLNTGFTSVAYPAATQLQFTGVTTFTDTCPVMVNSINAVPAANVTSLNVGCFVARPPSYSFTGVGGVSNFGGLNIANTMNASRYYFNQITIQPSLALDYISSNSAKTIIYDSMLYNTFTNIKEGGNFSQLIQSGVSNIKSVMVIPLVSANVTNFSAYKSPFDPVGGASGHPISLTNFQVQIGGTNLLQTSLYYTYENFIQQMSKFNKQSDSEYGVESGLISSKFWNNNRVYLVNVRSTEDDLNTPRNIVISFKNNSQVIIDILVFVVYEDKFVINVATGIITK